MSISKRFKRTQEGKFQCLKCDAVPFATQTSLHTHFNKEHGRAKRKAKDGRKQKRDSKALDRAALKKADDVIREARAALSPSKKDRMEMGQIRYCMHCGHEIPVGVIMREE